MAISSKNSPVTKVLNLDIDDLSAEAKIRARNAAGDAIVEAIQRKLDQSTSPAQGGFFSKEVVKEGRNAGRVSRLLDTGDLRSTIEWRPKGDNSIEVGVFEPDQRPIAYNHTTGETVPQRQMLPEENQNFKSDIMREVNSIINDIRVADELASDIEEGRSRITIGDVVDTITSAENVAIGQSAASQTFTLGSLFGGLFGNEN